ncbi:hypothetical protein EAL2_c09830 [Peptoclostridium acidaminophilum DSM 3953]|uniref:Positive regulator of sigma E, RseC/MucC n=1 Tax=Peptoclostridium acidaminophilum DSM 3953 TaxID=1286171 RepID=W8TJA0_PEPAC|nr:SoxR reducing system RseC family protein [Peptoclostridium acidaminophilum]AHM56282.1 hypothetical protein EAL2_c09830 [Peptoclostridium acidaminophilum DSM 3953]
MSSCINGIVVEKSADKAIVSIVRHSACAGCGACGMASESSKVKIEAINTVDANVGELVSIDMKNPDVLKAAFIAYGIPLLVLIAGVLSASAALSTLGYKGDSEVAAGMVSLLLTGAAYLIIRKNEDKIGKLIGYNPAITEVLKGSEIKIQ